MDRKVAQFSKFFLPKKINTKFLQNLTNFFRTSAFNHRLRVSDFQVTIENMTESSQVTRRVTRSRHEPPQRHRRRISPKFRDTKKKIFNFDQEIGAATLEGTLQHWKPYITES